VSFETFPIAGTRPRALDDLARDLALAEGLKADPKERAEHLTLVDLARNDVGRVCEYGSVSVPMLMEVHRYSHVQHMVSRVVGRLRRGLSCYDALKAVFSAGTVTGAPKVRAMEIIEELEPVRRGPYAGAVGYFSFNGNADIAITIRALVASGRRAYIQVGAGAVADSTPEGEWLETEHKASALLKALQEASGFVYLISVEGVTGARLKARSPIIKLIREVKGQSDVPRWLGSGSRGGGMPKPWWPLERTASSWGAPTRGSGGPPPEAG
jgi:anthranilate synthase component 1